MPLYSSGIFMQRMYARNGKGAGVAIITAVIGNVREVGGGGQEQG